MELAPPSLGQGEPITEIAEPGSRETSDLPRTRILGKPQGSLRGPRVRDLMMLLRRSHLYAGLLMLPWVFLYGLTGILFNHPTWFSDQSIISFGSAETRGTLLERPPTASGVAHQVVAAINAQTDGDYRLVEPDKARFERGGLSGSVSAGGTPYTVSLDPVRGGGTIRAGAAPTRVSPPARARGDRDGAAAEGREESSRGERGRRNEPRDGPSEAKGPLDALGRIEIEESPLERMKLGLPDVLAKVGLTGATVSEVRAAPLSFLVERQGRRWRASYDLQSGAISGRPVDEASAGTELTTRRFLLGLHKAHGYPSEFNARWVWAVIVDLMSAIMIFWGLSGMVMWWQIKRTRRLGSAALLISAVAAFWVFAEMHSLLLTLGR